MQKHLPPRRHAHTLLTAFLFLTATASISIFRFHELRMYSGIPSTAGMHPWLGYIDCYTDALPSHCVNASSLPLDAVNVCLLHKRVLQTLETGESTVGNEGVPHLLHQSWKTADLPEAFKEWSQTWKTHHPTWQYRLWTDDDNRALVQESYPHLLASYDALPENIERADVVRYLYMHKFGGVYADLDTWCLRDNGNMTDSARAIVAEMGLDHDYPHNIPNAWLGSTAGHPFWLFLAEIILGSERWWALPPYHWSEHAGPETVTGPVILKQAVEAWACLGGDPVKVLPPGYVYLLDWHTSDDHRHFRDSCAPELLRFDTGQDACLDAYPNAHVLTFWQHSWGRR